MENDDAVMAGEDERVRADEAGPETEGPETFELELDGETHVLPAALKGAFLRQADYTRKTQELSEHRRALEAERRAMAEHRDAMQGELGDRAVLAALDRSLDEYEGVDWDALAQTEPEQAQALWTRFQETLAAREQLAYAVAHHDERARLQAAREVAEAMAETGRQLSREIDGWSPEVAARLVEYAAAFGVTREELAQTADPRLWKLLHRAFQAEMAGRDAARAQAVEVRPAVTVAGRGEAAGVRDALSTREWMRRRNEQAARGR